MRIISKILWVFLLLFLAGCYSDEELIKTEDNLIKVATKSYKTENVIVVVVDGVRQSETWQNPGQQYIPKMANELAPKGVILTEFYNNGSTFTIPGHIAITTGDYEYLSNQGDQYPTEPSFFQLWLKTSNSVKTKAWIITSKEKLNVLADCKELEWRTLFNPSIDAITRDDTLTFQIAKEILNKYKPKLTLIHFAGPDNYGHANNWDKHLYSIAETDSLVFELWKFLGTDDYYKGKTTLIVTNDHGRHLDNIATGFVEHGDKCIGCTHLNFYATGPDFKENQILSTKRELVDILPTVGELMNFGLSDRGGEVMWELFK